MSSPTKLRHLNILRHLKSAIRLVESTCYGFSGEHYLVIHPSAHGIDPHDPRPPRAVPARARPARGAVVSGHATARIPRPRRPHVEPGARRPRARVAAQQREARGFARSSGTAGFAVLRVPPHSGGRTRIVARPSDGLRGRGAPLATECGRGAPPWTSGVGPLDRPWFVSGYESLKASALAESPAPFRSRNVFVLANFLERA